MQSRFARWSLGLSLIVATAWPLSALAAAKKYQVTGKVLEVNDKAIIVQKDDEKWELERGADFKVDGGELKVGAKVTIYYHMVADSADSKGAAKDGSKGK